MTSKSKSTLQAFLEYAMDAEGMEFVIKTTPKGFKAVPAPGKHYDPLCISAVQRNFRGDFGGFQ